jgi:DNA-directed RNA polymerase specialized sigma24 family protein
MTSRSGPGESRGDPDLSVIVSERRRLINLAYRLLGSLADAEDAVQETCTRWFAMSGQRREAIGSRGGWLTTIASRICRVTLDESVSMAFLVILESMTPAWRVAFVLHGVFGYSFADVAGIAGCTPAACRHLSSSARRRIREPPATSPARQADLVRDFKKAREAKDIDALIGLLDPGVTVTADGGRPGHRRAPSSPRRRAGRALPGRYRRPGTQSGHPGAVHGQRPARPGRPARRRHRDGVRVRHRGRPGLAHLAGTRPRQTPAFGGSPRLRSPARSKIDSCQVPGNITAMED